MYMCVYVCACIYICVCMYIYHVSTLHNASMFLFRDPALNVQVTIPPAIVRIHGDQDFPLHLGGGENQHIFAYI